jgi:acylphosphatase
VTVAIVGRRVVVEGRVQGVGYRVACARQARAAGLSGSVRNRPDRTVEAVFEGPLPQVEALIAWCRRGPSHAAVRAVSVAEVVPTGATDFRIEG